MFIVKIKCFITADVAYNREWGTMAKQKKQHYVPQFYLRNFANKENKFNIYNIKNTETIFNIPVKGQCQIINYYDEKGSKKWEDVLSKYEGVWATTFRKIIKKNSTLTTEDKKSLILFASFRNARSTQARDAIISKQWETLKIGVGMGDNNFINNENEEYLKDYFNNLNIETPAKILNSVVESQKYMFDLDVKVIKYKTQQLLIASDNPIIYNNRIYPNVGALIAGVLIFFPIDHRHLVVIYDNKIYNNSDKCHISCDESEVRKLNKYQLIAANNLIFGLDSYTFTKIKSLMKICSNDRKDFLEELANVTSIGPANKKIIFYTQPTIRRIRTHSFNKLTNIGRSFIKIKLSNRDWFPRTPYLEQKYKDRLQNKKLIFSLPDLTLSTNLNLTEIETFNRLVEEYWKIN